LSYVFIRGNPDQIFIPIVLIHVLLKLSIHVFKHAAFAEWKKTLPFNGRGIEWEKLLIEY
jgi:hypothetical protein